MVKDFQLNEVDIAIHCGEDKFIMKGITDIDTALDAFKVENSELFEEYPYKAVTQTGIHLFADEAERDDKDKLFKSLTQTHARNLSELVMSDFWTMVESTPDDYKQFPVEGKIDFFLTSHFPKEEFSFFHPEGLIAISNSKGSLLYARRVDGQLDSQQIEQLLEQHPEHVFLSLTNNIYGTEEVVDLILKEKVSQDRYMDSMEL